MMRIIAAVLVCLAVDAANLPCPNTVSCPCGKEGLKVTVCVRDIGIYEEVCASLLKCDNCNEDLCSKCLEGLEGSFCASDEANLSSPSSDGMRKRRALNRDTNELVYCSYPGDFANGYVFHIPPPEEESRPVERGEQYPAESQLEYTCDDGFTPKFPHVLECLEDGRWSGKPPTCTSDKVENMANCQNPGPVLNGKVEYLPPDARTTWTKLDYDLEYLPEGSKLKYECDENYRVSRRGRPTCQSTGLWSPKTPICEPDCGHSSMQLLGRVGNGVKTNFGDWPWVVSISRGDTESAVFICGGAIINSRTVITAAHCLEGYDGPLLLRFGKHHFRVQEDDMQVLSRRSHQIFIHPNYNNKTFDSDIGLILFQRRIPFSHRVQPICLPNSQSTARNVAPGKIGYISGWGVTESHLPPDSMMLAYMPVVSNQVCKDAYREQDLNLTPNMFCAGYEDAQQTVCSGDSGSPLVFKQEGHFTLEGLVSFGKKGECGAAGNYGIFTRVSNFLRWVRRNAI